MSQRSVTASPEWMALQDHYKQAKEWHMRDLFEQDPKRFEKFRSAGSLLMKEAQVHRGDICCGSFCVSVIENMLLIAIAKTTSC